MFIKLQESEPNTGVQILRLQGFVINLKSTTKSSDSRIFYCREIRNKMTLCRVDEGGSLQKFLGNRLCLTRPTCKWR